MNKQVKKFRTTTRNRQTHAITSAYMELDPIYTMILKRNYGEFTVNYLECLRDQFEEVREEVNLDEEARNTEIAVGEAATDDEEDNDADYDLDIPNLGRDALVDLLNAAIMLEH